MGGNFKEFFRSQQGKSNYVGGLTLLGSAGEVCSVMIY